MEANQIQQIKPLTASELKKLEIPLGKRPPLYRFFEILPGFLSYLVALLPMLIGVWRADVAAYLMMTFILIWFFRNVVMSFKALSILKKLRQAENLNWQEILEEDFYSPQARLEGLSKLNKKSGVVKFRVFHLRKFLLNQERAIDPKELIQVVMVPLVSEPYNVVKATIESIASNNYDVKNQVILQICPEARARDKNSKTVERIRKEYQLKFKDLIVSEHPAGLPDELIGKGANIDWAAQELLIKLKKLKIKESNVMITTLDGDNLMHKQYLANLAYTYLINLDRDNASYQPLALYVNNIWDAPALMRIIAIGNSFYTLLQAGRPHLQRNFSSHSQSLTSLLRTNFWSKRTIVEDGHQYWRSYIAFRGAYRVESMIVPNYQDAVLESNYRKTLKAQFTQLKRWAYGVSDIPYIFTRGLFGKDKISGIKTLPMLSRFLRHLENDISWAAAPFLLAAGAWLPILFARDSDVSVVAHQLPEIARWLQTFATLGALASIYVAFRILPKRPAHHKKSRSFWFWSQWILMPIVGVMYGSATGFYSQTRLMLGRYLDKFEFTQKHRK